MISYRIVLDGEARPTMAPGMAPTSAESRAAARAAVGAKGRPLDSNPQSLPARLWSRFRDLPRPVRVVTVLILFLFTIDMFDGVEDIWFHWPAAAGALFVFLWLSLVGHKKRQ